MSKTFSLALNNGISSISVNILLPQRPVPVPVPIPTPVYNYSPPPPVPPPCTNPPNISDQYAVYQQGMVLRYRSGHVQTGNTLVSVPLTANGSVVNGWYLSYIGRPGDRSGFIYWVIRLNNGESQTNVFNDFKNAADNGELANNSRVINVYTFCQYQAIG